MNDRGQFGKRMEYAKVLEKCGIELHKRKVEVLMENFWYDILLAIISAILGTFFGVIIPKLLKSDEKTCAFSVDKQLVFARIHVEQNQYIYNNPAHKVTVVRNSQKGQGMSGGEMLAVYVIGSLLLIYGFLRFESQISLIILIMTVLLESTFLTTAYMVTKKYYIDASIKSILLFNIFSTVCSPILLYLMKKPLMGQFVNKGEILNTINNEGIISLLFNVNAYGFLLYQALGVLILFGFMFFTMIGTLHILSMVNLTLQNRLIKVWRWLYKKTLGFCNSVGFYIGFGGLLLVMSFLFVSGILAELLNRI